MHGKIPDNKVVINALKNSSTDTVSLSWVQRRFLLSFLDARKLYQTMQSDGLIDSNGKIKIEQYPKDVDAF